MRICILGNPPWSHTGYGIQVRHLVRVLTEMDHTVACIANWGLAGGTVNWGGIPVYPNPFPETDPWNNWGGIKHALNFQADVVITVCDVHPLAPDWGKQNFRWIPYVPVDCEPLPLPIKERLKFAHKIVVMSDFGRRVISEAGLMHPSVIYHAIDTDVFKLLPRDTVEQFRSSTLKASWRDYVVGMVAKNIHGGVRKGFYQAFEAFAEFRKKTPHSKLYVHSEMQDPAGLDLLHLAVQFGIADSLIMPDLFALRAGFYAENHMALLFNAIDVLLVPSLGEAFCIPVIEALACGTPVVGTNFSSLPELIGLGHGRLINTASKYFPWQSSHTYQMIPDVKHMVQCLHECHEEYGRRKSEEVSNKIREQFSVDVFKNKWQGVLTGRIHHATASVH